MSYGFGKVTFADGAQDAFNRLRISEAISQFGAKFTYGVEEKLFNTTTTSGGTSTFLPNEAAYNLTVPTTNGARVLRQSFAYFQYHAGKSQLILMTGVFGSAVSGCVKRIGYYDDNDGLFYIQNGTAGFGVCERSSTSGSPVDTITYQSSWNQDKMDGTGPSGITLDVTKTNIFFIDFQWLGVGTVRYGVEINGTPYFVHYSHHANNTFTQVYMKSAWLPIRYEIINSSTTTGSTLKQICCAVMSEGGVEEVGNLYCAANTSSVAIGTGSWTPIISIQVGTTLNGYPFRGKLQITDIETLINGNQPAAYAIIEGGTLSGASWTSVGSPSAVSYDTSATSISGGTQRMIVMNGKSGTSSNTQPDELSGYAGTIYTIACKAVGGASNASAAINWREVI